ncbi:hypothetical protein [Lichenihabitans psoromatis]|uniref:hypothetical protein n=1 Tax=Lichenihabitans psoromatis TaxID=2528642 RepID=UPI0010368F06|nr:hypothetical protein [Lichenihabitans psoromatis]
MTQPTIGMLRSACFMFFLVRSAICIGIVVSLLPNAPRPSDVVATSASEAGQFAARSLDRACRVAPAACAGWVTGTIIPESMGAAARALATGAIRTSSRDTLTASDRQRGWAGPVLTARNESAVR